MKVRVITKNPGKMAIVEYVFPEIQAATSKEIAESVTILSRGGKQMNVRSSNEQKEF